MLSDIPRRTELPAKRCYVFTSNSSLVLVANGKQEIVTFHGRIEINPDEVQLWYAYDEEIAEENLLGQYYGLLSAEEREQQQRFHLAKHRHQYMITRALVRTVLSAYIDGIVPSAWKFRKNAFNKPYIASSPLPLPLRFNLSHTEKLVVMAVTLDREVGVDVEFLLRKESGVEDIAKSCFSSIEYQDLLALPTAQRKQRFFELWTLKEAYIKACGRGLSMPLDQFSLSFPEPGHIQMAFACQGEGDPRYWHLWQIKAGETHIVGLAVHNADIDKRYHLSMRKIVPLAEIADSNWKTASESYSADSIGRDNN